MKSAVLTQRKPCANPLCTKVVPLNWTFCKDRKCQGTRYTQKAARRAGAERWERLCARRKEESARSIKKWRANRKRRAEATVAASTAYRRKLYADALGSARGELRDLLLEQGKHDRSSARSSRWMWSLDEPVNDVTRADLIAYGYGPGGAHRNALHDPTAEAVIARDIPDLLTLVKRAPVIPADWRALLNSGDLVIDSSTPGFLVPKERWDASEAVPWRGDLASAALNAAGRMAHHRSKRARRMKRLLMKGKRVAHKSKVSA